MIQQIRARQQARMNGQGGQGGQGGQQGQGGQGAGGAGIGDGSERPRGPETDVNFVDRSGEGGKQSGGRVLSYKKMLGPGQRPSQITTEMQEVAKSESQRATESMEMENVPPNQRAIVQQYYDSLNDGSTTGTGGGN